MTPKRLWSQSLMTPQAKFRFWKRAFLTFSHKTMLVKAAIENFDSFLFKTFKLKKKDVDERFGRVLLLITMILWLHVYPFLAKIDVIFQTARACLGKSEIHKKVMTKWGILRHISRTLWICDISCFCTTQLAGKLVWQTVFLAVF